LTAFDPIEPVTGVPPVADAQTLLSNPFGD
jgi:hypothetical protein